jgi:carbonic anhydrase
LAGLGLVNAACKLSKQQLPINIDESKARKAALVALEFNYEPARAEVVNKGCTAGESAARQHPDGRRRRRQPAAVSLSHDERRNSQWRRLPHGGPLC